MPPRSDPSLGIKLNSSLSKSGASQLPSLPSPSQPCFPVSPLHLSPPTSRIALLTYPFSLLYSWGANLIVSSTFLTMLENVGAPGTFGYYSGWCAVAFVFLYFCYPETKVSSPSPLSTGLSTLRSLPSTKLTFLFFFVCQLLTLEESSSLFVDDFGIERSRRLRAHKLAVRRGAKDEVSDVGGEKDSI
jgi:hypothetical protein